VTEDDLLVLVRESAPHLLRAGPETERYLRRPEESASGEGDHGGVLRSLGTIAFRQGDLEAAAQHSGSATRGSPGRRARIAAWGSP